MPERTQVPSGVLFMGHPGKVRRDLVPEDFASIERYASRYIELAQNYRDEPMAGSASGPSKPIAKS